MLESLGFIKEIIFSFSTSLIITLLMGPITIPVLRQLKLGQNVRDDGPARHLQKTGTPTMGGLIFLSGITVSTFIFARNLADGLVVVGISLGFALIGFFDDAMKVVFKRPLGLRAREKLLGQVLLAAILACLVVFILGRGTALIIPFSGIFSPGGIIFDPGWWFYLPISIFIIIGTANAVNLTDGLDGLASGVIFLAALAFLLIALLNNFKGVTIVMAAIAGGCLGFLYYNRYPAKVFMGDTGSLALGGALAAAAAVTKSELFLLIIGGVLVLETLSVILQVISFQLRGRRLFLMSPLHHHFELKGWSEIKVVATFWVAAALFAILGLVSLYRLNLR